MVRNNAFSYTSPTFGKNGVGIVIYIFKLGQFGQTIFGQLQLINIVSENIRFRLVNRDADSIFVHAPWFLL